MTDKNATTADDTKTGFTGDTQAAKADPQSDSPIDQGQGGQTQAANDPRNQPAESGGEATGDGPKDSSGDAPAEPQTNTSDDLRR